MKNCIFCDEENDAQSIDHIVSESFGNKSYTFRKVECVMTATRDFLLLSEKH